MAFQATHIRYALDKKDILKVGEIDKYISGAIYPDSRYVTAVKRELTHPQTLLETGASTLNDFQKGWYTHLLYDRLLRNYTLNTMPDMISDIIAQQDKKTELWIRLTSLKILQDKQDANAFNLSSHLPGLHYLENPHGENTHELQRYNSFFQDMYASPKKLSPEYYYAMLQFWKVDDDLIKKIKDQLEAYQNNSFITTFLTSVYDVTAMKDIQEVLKEVIEK